MRSPFSPAAANRPLMNEMLEPRLLLSAALKPPTRTAATRTDSRTPDLSITLGQYHTYTSATTDLQSFASMYPGITRLISIGKSVQNRDIWAMEITDNPGVNEDEPEMFYEGSMHGDEPVGMEMCFYFINHLLTNYGTDARITRDVNNMDIWVVPDMNWDGYMHNGGGSSGAWRYNANGVDLNRNFPEWTTTGPATGDTIHRGPFGNLYDGPSPNTSGLQPEVTAMINFRVQHRFVDSANMHTGSLVVNYPWDGNGDGIANYSATPDDAMMRQLSLAYSQTNSPMYNGGGGFTQGITNGDEWYEVYGGMQDWSYLYTGDNETTIELNNITKYPNQSVLPTRWNENRDSMLNYMEGANWGVRGLVTDANTGAPLNARITLIAPPPNPTPDSHHPNTHSVYTDPAVGDYHRMLLAGTYTLKFEAAGYQTQTISNVTVASLTTDPTATARLNVQMVPIDTTPPTVTGGAFTFNGTPQSISFTFSEGVRNLDNTDLLLQNNTTSVQVPSSQINLADYNASSHVAIFTFNYAGGLLPGASYTASFNSAGVQDLAGNNLAGGYAYNFLYAPGTSGNDTIYVKQGNATLSVWVNANPQTDPATYIAVFNSLNNLSIDGLGGDDALTLDFTGGEVRPNGANGFGWKLGTGNESLSLLGSVNWDMSVDQIRTDTPSLTLNLSGGASANITAPVMHLNGLVINDGGSATVPTGGFGSRLLVLNALTVNGNGTLDLFDNDLIVDYAGASALDAIQAEINAARAGGTWTGNGITSTSARNANPRNTTLGAMEATDYKSVYGASAAFDAQAIDDTAVLVKYTYYGDTDFNGRVNFDDYVHTDSGFNNHQSRWLNGDFDGNGVVNFDDYVLIDQAFNTQGAAL
jgi:carboxypeptidase D